MTDFSTVRQFNFPTTIRFGAGAANELPAHLKDNHYTKPLIVTDSTIAELPFFKKIVADLKSKNISVEVFSNIHKNPVKSDVLLGDDVFIETQRDCVIGIGGGAALDVARAIVLRIQHRRDLFDYDDLIGGDKLITNDVPHFITVPTTSGTGSEIGRSAIIADDITHQKKILFSPKLMAKITFADPLLTMDLPPFITAATGMDALTHNMEAYLVNSFHPMCDGIALQAISLINESIANAVHRPDLESRSKMLMASMMGAVAFQKGLGVVHSLAHPLSSLLDTHHGLANAINLPYGMRFNGAVSKEKFKKIAQAMSLHQITVDAVVDHLFEMNYNLTLPLKLSEIGVTTDHIDTLSDLAVADFCHPANPRPVTKNDFISLYTEAL
jgi:alcohol dehydrogenase class IV